MSRRQRLSPAKRRAEIIHKAADFFAEQGFEGGTRDLASNLGVSQPLLYRYFSSKEELIQARRTRHEWMDEKPSGVVKS